MKVGVVYHRFVSEGGLERYLVGLVGALLGRGHGVDVVTSDVDSAAAACGAEVHVVPGGRVRTGRQLLAFDDASHRAVGQLDVDVVLGFGRTTRQDIHRAGGGCHQVYSRMLGLRRRMGAKNKVELELEQRLYRGGGTRRFVVNSCKVAAELQAEYGVDPGLVSVVRTAVDTGRYSPDASGGVKAGVRREAGTPAGVPVVLYAAREHRRKGLAVLLRAARDLPVEVWVAGPNPPLPLRRLAGPNTRFIGPQKDIARYYQAADWFVHPTRYDACANTVLQSMACGLPGIISVEDGAHELVADRSNGFHLRNPGSPDALREVLVEALALPDDDRVAWGAAARAAVLPLTWESHVEGWLEAIAELG